MPVLAADAGGLARPGQPASQEKLYRRVGVGLVGDYRLDTRLHEAVQHALRLAAAPAYAVVKHQLRARALSRIARIVEHDDDPLLQRWI